MSGSLQTWSNQDERRFRMDRSEAKHVLAACMSGLPVCRYNNGPITTLVSTVYFDTPSGYYYKRACSPSATSSIKIRAREYLPITDNAERLVLGNATHCFLERKERTGTARHKQRISIAKSDLDRIIRGELPVPPKATVVRQELDGRSLAPVLISMYERRVWQDDGLRVTFDERVRYYRPFEGVYTTISSLSPAELGQPQALGPKRILELKYQCHTALPPWLAALVKDLQEADRFSKFTDGIAQLSNTRRTPRALTTPIFEDVE